MRMAPVTMVLMGLAVPALTGCFSGLSSKLPACSIIRPTNTKGAATGVAKFLTDMGLFKGQSAAFFAALTTLARQADAARRG